MNNQAIASTNAGCDSEDCTMSDIGQYSVDITNDNSSADFFYSVLN